MADDPNQQQQLATLLIQKFSGLKNTIAPERLTPEELARGRNIDIDDVGQIRRRRGYKKRLSGKSHSLFSAAGGANYVVHNGDLKRLYPDFTTATLKANIGRPLYYTQVGPKIYASSEVDSFAINEDGTISPWGQLGGNDLWLSPVVNPVDDLPPIAGRLLHKVPFATAHAYWNGRIYMIAGRVMWGTELYLYDYIDKTKNFRFFEDDCTVIGAVTDGLYVGTTEAVYFLTGAFNEMRRIPLQASGAIPGSMVSVPAELINPEVPPGQATESKNAVVFLTKTGVVAGFDGGRLFNLTQNSFLFPDALSSSALFRRQDGVNQYIFVNQDGGGAHDAARFGDYLDADIVRRGDWGNLADGVVFGETWDAEVV